MSAYQKLLAATAVSIGATAFYVSKDTNKNKRNPVEFVENEKIANSSCTFVDNKFEIAIKKSQTALLRVKDELGLPGVVTGVSVNGKILWEQAFGLANVETQTPCSPKTKMRIASISKPITIALLAKLKESGLVDLDKTLQEYVPYFPKKKINGREVRLTPRLLACHKAGIRHYRAADESEHDGGPEFYLKERFSSVEKSVGLFQDDDLLFSPGDNFEYTTHGYTLLSAVIEGAAKTPFEKIFREHLDTLGLKNMHLDEISTLLYDRANYYQRQKNGRLKNAELTDNSYKWAGGGLVSNVGDLLRFADTMLYSYQQNGSGKPGYLTSETVRELWTPVPGTRQSWTKESGYGLGWTVVPSQECWVGMGVQERFHVGHGGGAVGASSVLLIFPLSNNTIQNLPSGVTVAIITNLQNAGLYKVGKEIANYFIEAVEKS